MATHSDTYPKLSGTVMVEGKAHRLVSSCISTLPQFDTLREAFRLNGYKEMANALPPRASRRHVQIVQKLDGTWVRSSFSITGAVSATQRELARAAHAAKGAGHV